MTKEEALNILKRVTENYKGTLQEHRALQEAIKVITMLVEPSEKKGK